MSNVVIFGNRDIAEIVHFYLSRDTDHKVVAFTVDGAYVNSSSFCGLPVIAFEEVTRSFPPDAHKLLVALSYTNLNHLRQEKYASAKQKGYHFINYISSRAATWGDTVIGDNCLILENVTIQPFVTIGNNVTIWSGSHIGHHVSIGNNCFITSQVVVSGCVEIGENCFVGVNATIRDHVKIGDNCIVGAGSLLMDNTEDNSVYAPGATVRSKVPSTRLRII